jgi:single-strand DNA-binding protein
MINNVTLVGRMTKEADLRYTPNGKAVATFAVAVNRTYSNQQGEREADFINCQVWGKSAENTANFTKKGSLVGVTGRIQVRTYDHDTKGRQYITEVVADSVQFLEPKNIGNTNTPESKNESNTGQSMSFNDDPFGGSSKTIDIKDQDLPF